MTRKNVTEFNSEFSEAVINITREFALVELNAYLIIHLKFFNTPNIQHQNYFDPIDSIAA